MVSRKIAERPQTGILNNFESFIKQVYQKKKTVQNIIKKKDQNNYFGAEITQKWEKLLAFKEIKQNDF